MITESAWRPYIAGALVGVLATVSVVMTTQLLGKPKYLGASTSYVRAVGLMEQQVVPEHVENNAYFQAKKVKVDWQMMMVAGVFFGALMASLSDRSFKLEKVPPAWNSRFGSSIRKRAGAAFLGGVVLMFGARLAGGCPSGHGLSGMMQLSLSGFIAMGCFFAGGIIMARIIYNGRGVK